MNRVGYILAALLLTSVLSEARGETYTPGQKIEGDFKSFAQPFLENFCIDCHAGTDAEAGLALDDLGPIDEVNAATWKSVWAQVALQEMPPVDTTEPEIDERLRFSDWIVSEMKRVMRDKGGFHAHLDPDRGNFVDHNLLFGQLPDHIKLVPTSSPARLWRVTPQEHITRLNELINTEPEYDPEKPGLRAHGDFIPTNHGGELKLYFGTDRITEWVGGTVAYATAVKSAPGILSTARKHGLKNYPDFSTVNSAEATQILAMAEDLIKYMAYGPNCLVGFPEQITDDPTVFNRVKPEGDIRGLPTSIVYSTKMVRPSTPVYELMKKEGITVEGVRAAVDYLFEALTFRPPSKKESDQYLAVTKASVRKLGKEEGVVLGLSAIFLDRDALFRPELVRQGKPDQYGRIMLQDWELGLAVNHALRFIKPDEELRKAIVEGRMRTRADVKREVERMLADDSIRKPQILQFFRDYFDYDQAGYICKDTKALRTTGVHSGFARYHYRAMFESTASTDRLVEMILQEDKDVLKQLLTTDKAVVYPTDEMYFGRKRTKEETAVAKAETKIRDKKQAEEKEAKIAALVKKETQLKANPDKKGTKKELERTQRLLKAARNKVPFISAGIWSDDSVEELSLSGPLIYARASRLSFGTHASFVSGSMRPERQLITVPKDQRLGILTHPSWLVSHSDAMDNHAIHRGRWVREKLLGGGVPDVPITVDAMLPDEPESTLRERMRVTREEYCWTCHEKMDPLGLPFEMYNHAGLFRTTELDKPVDTSGEIINSGDPTIDGKVTNAIDMIKKLAGSERAEQVFVRHAFRFWMGRNETVNDGPVLRDAHRAYRDNGGSMKAMLVSLLTSDAFLYRVNPDVQFTTAQK